MSKVGPAMVVAGLLLVTLAAGAAESDARARLGVKCGLPLQRM